jgi:flagellar hook-associated protein 3 FlgL
MSVTIATLSRHLRSQELMQRTRGELDRLTKEVATGTHADYFRGIGTQASRGIALRTTFSRLSFYKESATVASIQLDGQQQSLGIVKDVAIEVRGKLLSIQNGADDTTPAKLSEGAANFLEQVRSSLNLALAGRFVFSGPAVDTPPVPDSGDPMDVNTPAGVLHRLKFTAATRMDPDPNNWVARDLKDTAEMQAFLAEVDQVFSDPPANHPQFSYSVFYDGSTSGKMTARIDEGSEVSLDVRANDPALRNVLKSLFVLEAIPSSETSAESYRTLAEGLTTTLSGGIYGATNLAAAVGYREQLVNETLDRHGQTEKLVNNTISDLEGVDDYKAASRLTALQQQMEMTYTLTARLNQLSLVNFL